jgi:hypothetical protein
MINIVVIISEPCSTSSPSSPSHRRTVAIIAEPSSQSSPSRHRHRRRAIIADYSEDRRDRRANLKSPPVHSHRSVTDIS